MPIQLGELKLYSLKELSKSLGITSFTLRTYIRQGKLRARKMGTKWLVTEDALKEYFKETKESKKEDPFDPEDPPSLPNLHRGPLQIGDYVRIVGTLWEDEAHRLAGGNGGEKGIDGKSCWCSGPYGDCEDGDWGRGWFEIHPVDYMSRITPPSTSLETIEVLCLCDEASIGRDIYPPSPRPSAQSVVGFEELARLSQFALKKSHFWVFVAWKPLVLAGLISKTACSADLPS